MSSASDRGHPGDYETREKYLRKKSPVLRGKQLTMTNKIKLLAITVEIKPAFFQ